MYQEHFHLETLPFHLTPDTQFYCELPNHQLVFNTIMVNLRGGEGLMTVIGEVGTGKSILCQHIMHALPSSFQVIYLAYPDLTADGLRRAIALELHIDTIDMDTHTLLRAIEWRLQQLATENRKPVLFIDEAQTLSDDCLEALRLITNFEKNGLRLLQVILFAQPELAARLQSSHLRQLRQRIGFSCQLKALPKTEIQTYLRHRLTIAGYHYGNLFTKSARQLLYFYSHGLPRVINILSHKAMMVSFGRGEPVVDARAMWAAIRDTDFVYHQPFKYLKYLLLTLTISSALAGFFYVYMHYTV